MTRIQMFRLVIILAVILSIAGPAIWFCAIPTWAAINEIEETEDRISSRINFAKIGAELLLGFSALSAIYIAFRRVEVAQEGQVTERFTRAIDQLGNDKVVVRTGGIYALERIAKDSDKDHWQVIQVLMNHIPRKLSGNLSPAEDLLNQPVSADLQTILSVLGRLNTKYGKPDKRLDLRNTDLRGTDLRDINFRGANLSHADLRGVRLNGANLQDVILRYSDLRNADLIDTDLRNGQIQSADLRGTHMTKAKLQGANLTNANLQWGPLYYIGSVLKGKTPDAPKRRTILREAKFNDAILKDAHLEGSDLTEANLAGANLSGCHLRQAWAFDANDQLIQDKTTFYTILTGAKLEKANIVGANFTNAVGLTQTQVDSAMSDETTMLSNGLQTGRNR